MSSEINEINIVSPDFSIRGELIEGRGPVLHVAGKVLGTEAATLVDKVCHKLENYEGTIQVDLSECHFFSSVALGFISSLAYQRQRNGGTLVLCFCNDQIKKVIYMLGLGEILTFSEECEECDRSDDSEPC